jgi:hypothetical protein
MFRLQNQNGSMIFAERFKLQSIAFAKITTKLTLVHRDSAKLTVNSNMQSEKLKQNLIVESNNYMHMIDLKMNKNKTKIINTLRRIRKTN